MLPEDDTRLSSVPPCLSGRALSLLAPAQRQELPIKFATAAYLISLKHRQKKKKTKTNSSSYKKKELGCKKRRLIESFKQMLHTDVVGWELGHSAGFRSQVEPLLLL